MDNKRKQVDLSMRQMNISDIRIANKTPQRVNQSQIERSSAFFHKDLDNSNSTKKGKSKNLPLQRNSSLVKASKLNKSECNIGKVQISN